VYVKTKGSWTWLVPGDVCILEAVVSLAPGLLNPVVLNECGLRTDQLSGLPWAPTTVSGKFRDATLRVMSSFSCSGEDCVVDVVGDDVERRVGAFWLDCDSNGEWWANNSCLEMEGAFRVVEGAMTVVSIVSPCIADGSASSGNGPGPLQPEQKR
jgi:hypothetical protein